MIFLETHRLLLRSHEAEDENDFVKMHTDAEVRRYVGGLAWPLDKALHRFRNEYLGRPRKTYGLWAAILKEERKYVGCCGLRAPAGGAGAGLAYYIARPFWGRGLASEASKALIDVAFSRLRLRRISAHVEEGHQVSVHILKKFGFSQVSQEQLPGSVRIISLYQLLRTEWVRKRA